MSSSSRPNLVATTPQRVFWTGYEQTLSASQFPTSVYEKLKSEPGSWSIVHCAAVSCTVAGRGVSAHTHYARTCSPARRTAERRTHRAIGWRSARSPARAPSIQRGGGDWMALPPVAAAVAISAQPPPPPPPRVPPGSGPTDWQRPATQRGAIAPGRHAWGQPGWRRVAGWRREKGAGGGGSWHGAPTATRLGRRSDTVPQGLPLIHRHATPPPRLSSYACIASAVARGAPAPTRVPGRSCPAAAGLMRATPQRWRELHPHLHPARCRQPHSPTPSPRTPPVHCRRRPAGRRGGVRPRPVRLHPPRPRPYRGGSVHDGGRSGDSGNGGGPTPPRHGSAGQPAGRRPPAVPHRRRSAQAGRPPPAPHRGAETGHPTACASRRGERERPRPPHQPPAVLATDRCAPREACCRAAVPVGARGCAPAARSPSTWRGSGVLPGGGGTASAAARQRGGGGGGRGGGGGGGRPAQWLWGGPEVTSCLVAAPCVPVRAVTGRHRWQRQAGAGRQRCAVATGGGGTPNGRGRVRGPTVGRLRLCRPRRCQLPRRRGGGGRNVQRARHAWPPCRRLDYTPTPPPPPPPPRKFHT